MSNHNNKLWRNATSCKVFSNEVNEVQRAMHIITCISNGQSTNVDLMRSGKTYMLRNISSGSLVNFNPYALRKISYVVYHADHARISQS